MPSATARSNSARREVGVEVGLARAGNRHGFQRQLHGGAELAHHFAILRRSRVELFLERGFACTRLDFGQGANLDLLAGVIKGQHGAEDEKAGIVARAGNRLHRRIKPARSGIAQVAHAASGHGRDVLGRREFAMGELAPQDIHGGARLLAFSAGILHGGYAIAAAHHHGGIGSEEGIARQMLAALDGLQQERTLGALGDPQVSRERSQQVGGNRFGDGNQSAGGCQPAKIRKLGAVRHLATTVPAGSCFDCGWGGDCGSYRVRPKISPIRRSSPTMAANCSG